MGLSSLFPYPAGMLYLQKCPDKIRLRDYLPVYKEPLPDIHKMGGHECPAGNFCFPDHGSRGYTDKCADISGSRLNVFSLVVPDNRKNRGIFLWWSLRMFILKIVSTYLEEMKNVILYYFVNGYAFRCSSIL